MTDALTTDAVANLYDAWAKAQADIDNISQGREVSVKMREKPGGGGGGTYKFTYATLAQILHQIRKPLTDNGLWYTQYIRQGWMITRVFHKSGEWMETGLIPMAELKGGPQDIGSLISYFKRYSLSAAMGLASEEDNDGEQGDREVTFRDRNERNQRNEGPPNTREATDIQPPPLPEPEGGYGDWSRAFIDKLNAAATESLLDDLIAADKQYINGSRRFDQKMYEDIGKVITNKRIVLNDEVPF